MITRIGQGSAEATTITIPAGHKVGDLLIIFSFRDGSTTNPTIPAGWTTLTNTFDGTTCSVSVGWKIATSASETSGTWTNATGLMVIVLRGHDDTSPMMANSTNSGSTNTLNFAAITDTTLLGASGYYIFAFIAHRSIDTNISSAPPTGMSNILNAQGGATQGQAIHEVVAPASSWASQSPSITGTASGWQSMVLAIRPTRQALNNFQDFGASVGNTGIISVSERSRS